MRQLKESGTSIVFITHKLREVRAVADRITVIRRGKVVGTAEPSASRRPSSPRSWSAARSSLGVDAARRRCPARRPCRSATSRSSTRPACASSTTSSFDVARGEIVAIAGVQGNGQTELTEVMLGLQAPVGRLRAARRRRAGGPLRRATCSTPGVGFVPEDRSTDGVIADFSIAENLILDLHATRRSRAASRSSPPRCGENAERRIVEFDVRTGSIDAHAEHAVRRQPAEGRPGARDVAAAAAAHRLAADPRPGRRLDRVRALADRRRSATTGPR